MIDLAVLCASDVHRGLLENYMRGRPLSGCEILELQQAARFGRTEARQVLPATTARQSRRGDAESSEGVHASYERDWKRQTVQDQSAELHERGH
jgi:hypothetical protein